MTKKPTRMEISNSDIEAMRECKRKGMETMLHPRASKAGPARAGQAAHAVMETVVRFTIRDKEALASLVDEQARHISEADEKTLRLVMDGLLNNDFQFHLVEGGRLTCEVRERIEIEPELFFAFTPDVWVERETEIVIVDWKSAIQERFLSPPKSNTQLKRYAAAMFAKYGKPVRVVLYYLKRAEFDEYLFDVEELAAMLAELKAMVIATRDSFLNHKSPRSPTVGEHCRRCDWRGRCPAFRWFFVATPNPECAAERVVLLEAALKDARAELTASLASGPVVASGVRAELVEREKYTYVPGPTLEELRKILPEENVVAAISFTSTSIEKAIRKAPGVGRDDVEKYLRDVRIGGATLKKDKRLSVKRLDADGRVEPDDLADFTFEDEEGEDA